MAVTKPTFYPDGTAIGDATDISVTLANISNSLRTSGYATGAKLASSEYNEMFKELSKWIKYLESHLTPAEASIATLLTSSSINNAIGSTSSGKISWITLNGTCGVTGDMTGGSGAIVLPASITPTSVLSIDLMLEFTGTGISRWARSGQTIPTKSVSFYWDYYNNSTYNIVEIFSRGSDVNYTTTKYKIVTSYLT